MMKLKDMSVKTYKPYKKAYNQVVYAHHQNEQEENEIDIEEIMGSLEVTEEEKQQITKRKY